MAYRLVGMRLGRCLSAFVALFALLTLVGCGGVEASGAVDAGDGPADSAPACTVNACPMDPTGAAVPQCCSRPCEGMPCDGAIPSCATPCAGKLARVLECWDGRWIASEALLVCDADAGG